LKTVSIPVGLIIDNDATLDHKRSCLPEISPFLTHPLFNTIAAKADDEIYQDVGEPKTFPEHIHDLIGFMHDEVKCSIGMIH
jgi:hypothetical protein